MEAEALFQFNFYTVKLVDNPGSEEFDNKQPVNYKVVNDNTGCVEMRSSTFVQAVNMAIELSNAEQKIQEYLDDDEDISANETVH